MRSWPIHIALLLLWCGTALAARPIFENRTPAGFSSKDSTTQENFVSGSRVEVRVDLNQAATEEYPVIGDFYNLERSVRIDQAASGTDGMQVDIAMVDVVPFGTNSDQLAPGDTTSPAHPAIHMAWIEQTTSTPRAGFPYTAGTTPVYKVMYTRSFDGGSSFSTPVSVSGNITYHPLTANGGGGSFSTLDLEVDSGGRPRLVYALVSTANRQRRKNVYFSYSQDGGGTWQTPVVVNDAATVGTSTASGRRNCAFPRMVIDDRDEIFISYVRGASSGGGTDDVMLTKVNRFTSPFSILPVGETGTAGTGGLRLAPDADRQTGPDLAVGDGDALHLIYFNSTDNRIEHKRLGTDTTWVVSGSSGWNQDVDGATVGSFDESANNALEVTARYFFPSLAVDRNRTPNRVYSLYKYGDNTPVEGIYFNRYDDNGALGSSPIWGTAGSIWNTTGTPLFADGAGQYNIELDWEITERVSAVVDDRTDERGDLHIAFTAGYSGGGEQDVYYARYNGASWTLPEKVADDDSDAGTEDGIAAADVFLLSPVLVQHPDRENLFLAFAGGTGEGFGLGNVTNVDHHAYFKVLGRKISWEDESVPVGGYQYNLAYTPVNPHTSASEVANNLIYVHAADPASGLGLGARADSSDGFLAGDWETVGSSLADDDKYYEGLVDELSTSTNEWGDDDDKIGLLVKLDILGSDSATNVQAVTNSTAGTGKGARTVRVANSPNGSFVAAGDFFRLGADIDIVAANTAPTVSISEPNGTGDQANTEYTIQYSVNDADDGMGASGSLKVALYAYPSGGLLTVQDIRIFGTLIADENDALSSGTGDLTEGTNQTYTWDDPPATLKSSALFASIYRVPSGNYYIYLVADDGKNDPVFAVSSGPLTIRHSPLVRQIDPIVADTVDTGVRTGLKANPYDLDFSVVDYDSEARIQLFYASVAGIASVSAKGSWPNQKFVLGKSLAGTRGTAITDSTTLTGQQTEYSWDVSSPLVAEGSYYLYAVASDSISASVGYSSLPLIVKHSPSFTFYEPAKDTQRRIDSGSQPVYVIQWQKGPGDGDLDHDASISLYFTTDDPAVTDHSTDAGASATSLTSDADTQLIVSGLTENGDGASDMYSWNLRTPPNAVPKSGRRVWIYALIADGSGNTTVSRGGSLIIDHNPFILLESRMPSISQGDIVRLEWDDYMVDDGSGTDDAYIRLYASTNSGHTTLQSLESGLSGSGTYLINSTDGTLDGTLTTIREDSSDAFNWDTRTGSLTLAEGNYYVYAGISADPTFADNTAGKVSMASNPLVVGVGTGTTPHLSLSPNKVEVAIGDTLTFEIAVQSGGQTAESIGITIDLSNIGLGVINSAAPFTDLGEVFSGGTVVENTTASNVIRFTKNKAGGEIVGSSYDQKRLARFQLVAGSSFSGRRSISFSDLTAISISGSSTPLKKATGLSVQNAQVQKVSRGRILATVLLEGRSGPLGNGDHTTLLDVHLRLPGGTIDITDSRFRTANDKAGTVDTVQVQTTSSGGLTLTSVPAGRYVLAVKDSSHLSGRTDTLTVRNGETLLLSSSQGFFSSDVRGDPSFLLGQDGRQLKAGDVTGDNEIDEDDVNAIDAAWGTNTGAANFAKADLNNDVRVGVEDLTVTSSNISNSTGFGAPPVYKRTSVGNAGTGIELLAPDYAGEWRRGEELELVLLARDLGDMAGYGLALEYDPLDMEIVEGGVRVAELFHPNPRGFFARVEREEGRLAVAAARRGNEWTAAGDGELLRVKVRLFRDGFPQSLAIGEGQLLSSRYESTPIRLIGDPGELALPKEFTLRQNFPNPFNPSTTIPFSVPSFGGGSVPVSVEIFNALGQRVRTLMQGTVQPGYHRALWDGRNGRGQPVASGVYLYRVRVGEVAQVGKMTLLQ